MRHTTCTWTEADIAISSDPPMLEVIEQRQAALTTTQNASVSWIVAVVVLFVGASIVIEALMPPEGHSFLAIIVLAALAAAIAQTLGAQYSAQERALRSLDVLPLYEYREILAYAAHERLVQAYCDKVRALGRGLIVAEARAIERWVEEVAVRDAQRRALASTT